MKNYTVTQVTKDLQKLGVKFNGAQIDVSNARLGSTSWGKIDFLCNNGFYMSGSVWYRPPVERVVGAFRSFGRRARRMKRQLADRLTNRNPANKYSGHEHRAPGTGK